MCVGGGGVKDGGGDGANGFTCNIVIICVGQVHRHAPNEFRLCLLVWHSLIPYRPSLVLSSQPGLVAQPRK